MRLKNKIILLGLVTINSFASNINIDKLLLQSQKEHKKVLIFFHMTYCSYCNKMLHENFKKEKFLNKLKKDYIYVDINIDKNDDIIYENNHYTNIQFSSKNNVHFFPTTKFIDNNKIIYTVKGYRNPIKFNYILKYISSNNYKNIGLEEFISNTKLNEN